MDASYIILSYVLHIFKGRRHPLHTQCICWLGLAGGELEEKYDGFLVITGEEKPRPCHLVHPQGEGGGAD